MNNEITISSWNILTTYDGNTARTEHQSDRVPNIVSSVRAVQPDICGLYEVMKENTDTLAKELDQNSLAEPYNESGYDMALQLLSAVKPETTEIIEFPMDERKAIVATIAGICVVASHLSFSPLRFDWRVKQVRQILEATKDQERAVVMADFNCMPWQKPRKMLKAAGFTSVTETMHPPDPVTFPSPLYRPKLSLAHRLIAYRGLRIDDIYIKGLDITDSGLIEGDSDHFGVWATVRKQQ